MPVPVFCCFSISVFPHIKSARKILGKIQEKSAYRKLPEEPGRGQRGAKGGPGGHPAQPHPWPRQGGAWGPWSTSGCPPSPIYSPSRGNSEDRTLFRKLASVPPQPRFQDREHRQDHSRHPAGGRIDLRELPLLHGRFPDVT